MKPIIIVAVEKDGQVTITRDELQRIVDEAYKQGQADGNHYYYTNPPTWISTNPNTTPNSPWDYTKVTC